MELDPDPPKKERSSWMPRPPESASRSTADFVVTIFAITVATLLVILTIGVVIAGIRGSDISAYFAVITSIVTSIISALVGFLAGKGQGKLDAQNPPTMEPPP